MAGFRRTGEPTVTPDAHWQLGSLTKKFTGTLAELLVERGKLSWHTTLGQIYPEHMAVMTANVANIAIRHLATHRSGMVDDDAYGWTGGPAINGPGLTPTIRRHALAAARGLPA